MEQFPFSAAEWRRVSKFTGLIAIATYLDDDVLAASHFASLQVVLDDLCKQHGEHPVLMETGADFTTDETASVRLYPAVCLAGENQLPTLSIRLSLARILLDQQQAAEAAAELLAAKFELESCDDYEGNEWRELTAQLGLTR